MLTHSKILWVILFMIASVTAAEAGLTGTITYEGELPKRKKIRMSADPVCLTKHKEPVYSSSVKVSENKGLADVFVHVLQGLPKKKYDPPAEPVVLDQKGCVYTPHVLGVMVGQTLEVLNPDGTLHNVHGSPKLNKKFNLAMPKFRKKLKRTFDKAEFMFKVKCDVHPWMGAWIAVMDHPYFTVSDTEGSFKIVDLPDGEYEIEAWHEKLGTQKQKITVSGGSSEPVQFVFKP